MITEFRETLEIELKEFTLKLDPVQFINEDDIKNLLLNGKIKDINQFNNMIHKNIIHYINYYIPRYISVFGNSDLDYATLYIGVNDTGEITGIPYVNEFTKECIDSILSEITINKFISYENNEEIQDILNNLKFEFIKVEINTNELDDNLSIIIDNFETKKNNYIKQYNKSIEDRNEWLKKLDYYITTRISMYAIEKKFRNEIALFILENNKDNDIKLNNLCELLYSNQVFEIGDGNEIKFRKEDKYDIVYWITQFKDFKVNELKKEKPNKVPYCSFSQNIYINQLCLLSNLRYKLIQNNKELNYYILKVSFPTKSKKKIYFKNNESDIWNIRKRVMVNNTPGCC